jgi:hypothetical protein
VRLKPSLRRGGTCAASLAPIWRSARATQGRGCRLTKGVRLERGHRQGRFGLPGIAPGGENAAIQHKPLSREARSILGAIRVSVEESILQYIASSYNAVKLIRLNDSC